MRVACPQPQAPQASDREVEERISTSTPRSRVLSFDAISDVSRTVYRNRMINIHRYRTYSTLSERTLLDCPHFDVLLTYTHISNRWMGRTTSHDQYLCTHECREYAPQARKLHATINAQRRVA
jgi:hypothetical protein